MKTNKIMAQIAENNATIDVIRMDLSMLKNKQYLYRKGEITWDQYYSFIQILGDLGELENRINFLEQWNEALTGNIKYMSEHMHSDIHAYEIIDIKTPKRFVIRRMKATETEESKKRRLESFIPGGFCGHFDNDVQDWTIETDPEGWTIEVSVRNFHGAYRIFMVGTGCSTPFYFENEPYYKYDFNF